MSGATTLEADVERFLVQGQATGWRPATLSNYRFLLLLLTRFLALRGCRRSADATRDDLDAFLLDLREEGYLKGSRVRCATIVVRYFTWLQDHGRVLVHPAKALPMPDDGEADLPKPPLSEAEVAALIDSMPRATIYNLRNVLLLELLYGCGLRISEALHLDLVDIDLGRRTVAIRESKHGQSRVVPLPNTAKAALQTYLSLRRTLLRGPDHGALFLTQYGTRWKYAYGLFNDLNACGVVGVRLHPHLLRHSIAVHLLRRGADIRYIQAFLGHACLDTTKVYLRLVPGHLKEDYDRAMPEIEVGLPKPLPEANEAAP